MRASRSSLLSAAAVFAVAWFAAVPRTAARAEDAIGPKSPPPKKPILWVIDGPPRIYLFGTVHVPDDRVKDLPRVVTEAHAASDVVWGELSLKDQDSPEILKAMMLPPGKSLGDVVPKETIDRVHAYLESRGSPTMMLDRFKATWAAVFVSLLDALPLFASRVPMDKQLLKDAEAAGKESGGLEDLKTQIDAFESLTPEDAAKFLDQTIKDLEKAKAEKKNPLDGLIDAYAAGDLDAILAESDKMSKAEDPALKALGKRLLTDRNVVMVDRLLERTAAAPDKTYFVAVGAAHYPGSDGVLALLEKKGKKARRMTADEEIPKKAAAATK